MQNFTTKETAKDPFQPISNRAEAGGNSPEISRPSQHRVHTDQKLTIISSTLLFGKRPKRRHAILKESNKKTPKVYGRDPRMLPRLYAARKGQKQRDEDIRLIQRRDSLEDKLARRDDDSRNGSTHQEIAMISGGIPKEGNPPSHKAAK
ncbi:hypothetical protein PIB30_102063 [Stylosanthes scabra]|uniref:Uncharacterized protein n=1 Tax=Stylosanthes scabra TaxID=79078 RepID=A0ABU6U0L3_9FABA|nr:hypothetical protein [Stylosanthes scabra]